MLRNHGRPRAAAHQELVGRYVPHTHTQHTEQAKRSVHMRADGTESAAIARHCILFVVSHRFDSGCVILFHRPKVARRLRSRDVEEAARHHSRWSVAAPANSSTSASGNVCLFSQLGMSNRVLLLRSLVSACLPPSVRPPPRRADESLGPRNDRRSNFRHPEFRRRPSVRVARPELFAERRKRILGRHQPAGQAI